MPPTIAQKMRTGDEVWASIIASAPTPYPHSPRMYARLRPMRSPTLLPMRMNAADTSASRAIADWTPLTVVPRSWTTAEIETFMSDVSTTRTNIAMASSRARRVSPVCSWSGSATVVVISARVPDRDRGGATKRGRPGRPLLSVSGGRSARAERAARCPPPRERHDGWRFPTGHSAVAPRR